MGALLAALKRPSAALLLCALLAGGALRSWLALRDDGIYWPDEIYQSLEMAHRWVFGRGMVPWEYSQGARTVALPGLTAAVMKISAALGLDQPRGYLAAVKLFFAALAVATAWASARLARSLGTSKLAAAVGACFFALAAPAIYFGARALSENASMLPLVLGLSLALPREASTRQRALGAALLSLAVLFRLHNAVFCAGLLGVLAARRDWRGLRAAGLTLVGGAAFYGIVDHLSWSGFFHSAQVYLKFTLVEGKSSLWGTADALYYLRVLWRSMPAPLLLLLPLTLLALRRAAGLLAITAAFLAVHMATPHKELRFILPALPLLGALAALGLEELMSSPRPIFTRAGAFAAVASVLALFHSAYHFHSLRFADVGQYESNRPDDSAYDDFGDLNRLMTRAGQRGDLCGLKIELVHLAWTGGYSYFHKAAPLYHLHGPGRGSGYFNYVIAPRRREPGVVDAEGRAELIKLRDGCKPDPMYSFALP